MTDSQTIDLLRFALSAVWTECEKDTPSTDDCQQIAWEAMNFSIGHASPGKRLDLDGQGMESWKQYLQVEGVRVK